MSSVYRGRYTASIEGSFVVFIIGMRVNRLWAIHSWLPVALAMRSMIKRLRAESDIGLLHSHQFVSWRGAALVQYWRSFEHLERFARHPSLSHLDAWERFNRTVGADGSVGIWHETYVVPDGQYECIYGNMPRFGLAAAGSHHPVVDAMETSRRRLRLDGEPAVSDHGGGPAGPR